MKCERSYVSWLFMLHNRVRLVLISQRVAVVNSNETTMHNAYWEMPSISYALRTYDVKVENDNKK